jgi:adiponectin receptor
MYFFCAAAFLVMLVPQFNHPKYIVLRGSLFVTCGLISCIPMIHMEFFLNPIYLEDFIGWPWALGGAIYIFGALLYMTKVPERCKPGSFDICVNL